jgi:hypothetical protein
LGVLLGLNYDLIQLYMLLVHICRPTSVLLLLTWYVVNT